jgi:hypothetical protein
MPSAVGVIGARAHAPSHASAPMGSAAESRRMLRYVASPHCPHPTVASTFTKPCCASYIKLGHTHARIHARALGRAPPP